MGWAITLTRGKRLQFAVIAASLLLLATAFYIYQGKQQPFNARGDFLPSLLADPRTDPPIFGHKVSSIAEAQARLPYPIPLPQYIPDNAALTEVLVGITEPSTRQMALVYANGIDVVIRPQEFVSDWQTIVAEEPGGGWGLVNVRGTIGEGHEAGVKEVRPGVTFEYSAGVSWWENGFVISIYSYNHSLAELLRVAESLPALSRPQ